MAAAALLASLVLAPAVAQPARPVDVAEIERGRDLAERLCALCHMRGNQSEKASADAVPGFQAVARRPGQTRERIVAWLAGVPPMMPNHRLTRDEMESLAAFIETLRD
jgi:mono/diheme cytochrome c family protein